MSKPKFGRNYARRKLELVLRDLRDYTADEFWREISRIASGATGLPSVEHLKGHAEELEAINLELTKMLLEEGSEKAKLVEALEDIGASWHGVNTELERYMRNVARLALAATASKGVSDDC